MISYVPADDPNVITPAVYRRANARGRREMARRPEVVELRYVPSTQTLRFGLADGSAVELPVARFPELAALSEAERHEVVLFAGGSAVMHEARDLHLLLAGLWADCPELCKLAQAVSAMRRGRANSPAKAEAARINGQRGGRPKKSD